MIFGTIAVLMTDTPAVPRLLARTPPTSIFTKRLRMMRYAIVGNVKESHRSGLWLVQ